MAPTVNISDNDVGLLKAVLEVMKADIKWDVVAEKANMKTSKYARDRWTTVRNKIIAGESNGKQVAGDKRKDSALTTPASAHKKMKIARGKRARVPSADTFEANDDTKTTVKEEGASDDEISN